MRIPRFFVGLVLATSFAGSCERRKERPSKPAASESGFRITQPSQAGLVANLQAEESRRTDRGGTPRAEAVLSAIELAGVKVEAPRQYLAASVDATYCVGGRSSRGLAIAVCEYPDAAAARSGRAVSLEKFGPADGREVHARGPLTLSVTGVDRAGEKSRAVDAFERTVGAQSD